MKGMAGGIHIKDNQDILLECLLLIGKKYQIEKKRKNLTKGRRKYPYNKQEGTQAEKDGKGKPRL